MSNSNVSDTPPRNVHTLLIVICTQSQTDTGLTREDGILPYPTKYHAEGSNPGRCEASRGVVHELRHVAWAGVQGPAAAEAELAEHLSHGTGVAAEHACVGMGAIRYGLRGGVGLRVGVWNAGGVWMEDGVWSERRVWNGGCGMRDAGCGMRDAG